MSVPQVMEPSVGKSGRLGNLGERMGYSIRIVRLPICFTENIITVPRHKSLSN